MALCKMAKCDKFNSKHLDLVHTDALPIKKIMNDIDMLYATDFKEDTAPVPNVVTHKGVPADPITDSITVQLRGGPLTEDPITRACEDIATVIVATTRSLIALAVAVRDHCPRRPNLVRSMIAFVATICDHGSHHCNDNGH